MSYPNSPDTSEAQKKFLFSGKPNGPLPHESEDVETIYDSDSTDLTVYDYSGIGRHPTITFHFEESDNFTRITPHAMKNFDDFVEELDGEPRNILSDDVYNGVYRRLAKKIDELEHQVDEYMEDFRNLDVDEILED